MHVAGGVGGVRDEGLAVLAGHVHIRAFDRRAVADRLHVDVVAAVERFLRDHAEVGDDDQARVAGHIGIVGVRVDAFAFVGRAFFLALLGLVRVRIDFLLRRLRLQLGELEQEHAVLRIRAAAEILAEVDAFEARLGRIGAFLERHLVDEALGDLVRAQRIHLRLVVRTLVESDQVLQLVRQHACDFDLHAGHVARDHTDALVAGQRQQRTVGGEAQHLRILGHGDDLHRILAEHVAAERLEPLVYSYVDIPARIGLVFEAVQVFVVALGRNRLEAELLRALQHGFVHIGQTPIPGIVAIVVRQQPGGERLLRVRLVHGLRRVDDEHLLGFVLGVVDQRRLDALDLQAVQPGHRHIAAERLLGRRPAARGAHAFGDGVYQRFVIGRNRQRLGVNERVDLAFVVGDRELLRYQRHFRTAQLELDGLFKTRRIDRMGEARVDHGFLRRRVLRVLIELALHDARLERRTGEIETVLVDLDVLGEGELRIEIHRVFLPDRPVVLRREVQFAVVEPGPGAGQIRLHRDARGRRLADQRQRRDRAIENDVQRMHDQLARFVVVAGQQRRLDGERGGRFDHGLGPVAPGAIAEQSAESEHEQRDENSRRACRPSLHGAAEPAPARFDRAHPRRRVPAKPAEEKRQHRADEAQQHQRQIPDEIQQPHSPSSFA